MKKSVLVSLFVLMCTCLALSGCGKKAPGCADDEVVALVMEIAGDYYHLDNNLQNEEVYKWGGVEAIRTQRIDNELGKCYCAAELHLTAGKDWRPGLYGLPESRSEPVDYSAEWTEDGQLYVSIYDIGDL
jgi:predicted small lipoprotein YifL